MRIEQRKLREAERIRREEAERLSRKEAEKRHQVSRPARSKVKGHGCESLRDNKDCGHSDRVVFMNHAEDQ